MPGIRESWHTFTTHVKPGRLLQEDPGVKGPLWFGSEPDSPLHTTANLLRLFFAIFLAPIYLFISGPNRTLDNVLKRIIWGIEWSHTPDAVLLEAPGSSGDGKQARGNLSGQYAVTGNKPKWLLEVEFSGTKIVSQKQVKYWKEQEEAESTELTPDLDDPSEARLLREKIQQSGYTAISYAMKSAEEVFKETKQELYPQPEVQEGSNRKYSLRNRKKISQALLDDYARARITVPGKVDGTELIWLDEFCLSDNAVTDEKETKQQRDMEVGQLADIFRGARRVVVFCHVVNCDHTRIDCPWGNRLFTIGEILHTPEVLRMTRAKYVDGGKPISSIIAIPGQEFRGDMQARAAEAKMWHLYSIMQHATNSGAVSWQSAIHSLVVEAIRRDEADNFHAHNFLGKALNGLLPRRSQLEDLQGTNGWADLAWLLELNQGYYNAALLAAVCRLADPKVKEYRWWGKPIAPKEGSERLEALVTAFPVKIRNSETGITEPVLSIIGPKSIHLDHMLRRDSGALYHRKEMQSLKRWATSIYVILLVIGVLVLVGNIAAGITLLVLFTVAFVIFVLLTGTIYVDRDTWIIVEDHAIQGRDPYQHIQSQDPSFAKASEWGPRQLFPQWDVPQSAGPSPPGQPPRPYSATLIDLRTGVLTRVVVTSRPNNMVVLAVHGSGITCMLLDRDEDVKGAMIAVKVGMANLPPFALAQADDSGTVYVGGGPIREKKNKPRQPLPVPHPPSTYPTYPTTPQGGSDEDVEKLGKGHHGLPT